MCAAEPNWSEPPFGVSGWTPDNAETSQEKPVSGLPAFYERAVQLDPAFAVAWARLSRANAQVYFGGLDRTTARRDAAERALNIAQRLQPNSPEALLAQAYYQYWVLRDYELESDVPSRPGAFAGQRRCPRCARRQGTLGSKRCLLGANSHARSAQH